MELSASINRSVTPLNDEEKRLVELLMNKKTPQREEALCQLIRLEGSVALLQSLFPRPTLSKHCVACHADYDPKYNMSDSCKPVEHSGEMEYGNKGEYCWSCCGTNMGSYEYAQDAEREGGHCLVSYHIDDAIRLKDYDYDRISGALDELYSECEVCCPPENSVADEAITEESGSKKNILADDAKDPEEGPIKKKVKIDL